MVKSSTNATNAIGSKGQGQRKGPTWKYDTQVSILRDSGKKGYVYLECKFCRKTIKVGVKRLKDHLEETHKNVAPCLKVRKEVKQEMFDFMKNFTNMKHMVQRNLEEMVGSGSYFGSGSGNFEEKNSCPGGSRSSNSLSSREIRGPMDRFLIDLEENEDDVVAIQKITPTTAKRRQEIKFV